MIHNTSLRERGDGQCPMTSLQSIPIGDKFCLMQFSPGFDWPLLAFRQRACQQFHRLNPLHCHMLLVLRVEVRRMVRSLDLDKHSDDNAKETATFRHPAILLGCIGGRKKLPLWGVRWDRFMLMEEKEVAACNYTETAYGAGCASRLYGLLSAFPISRD
jgi:hypothetical protein